MNYVKTAWVDNSTLANAEHMNNIEDGIYENTNSINTINSQIEELQNTGVDTTARSSIATINTQLADNPIKPESFIGTDYEKLQQAFTLAISSNRAVCISKIYDIGDNTIDIGKAYSPRSPLYVFGGGTIKKSVAGFIFTSTISASSDYFFKNITFEGSNGISVKVFDCSSSIDGLPKLIRITTDKCFFRNIHTVFFSDIYVQTIRMNQDTITGCTNAVFDIQGGININTEGLLSENCTGSFIKHGCTGTIKQLFNCSFIGGCLEDFSNSLMPVFDIGDVIGLNIKGIYFEHNVGGSIVFKINSILQNVHIEDLFHSASADYPTLITWGKTLINCYSVNNTSTIIPIHNTTNVTSGRVISLNDISNSTTLKDIELNQCYLYHQQAKLPSAIDKNKKFATIAKNGSFEAVANWNAVNSTITYKTDTPFEGLQYLNVLGTANSGCVKETINDVTEGNIYMVYLASKSVNVAPFWVLLTSNTTGEWAGSLLCTPTKSNEWEEFSGSITISKTLTGVGLVLCPALETNSNGISRDFDAVTLCKVDKKYNPTDFINGVGYIINKFGTTANRPILSILDINFQYFDTTLNKSIWWNGTNWVDATGTTV